MIPAAGRVSLSRLFEDFKLVSCVTAPSTHHGDVKGFISAAVHHCSKLLGSAEMSFSGVSGYSSMNDWLNIKNHTFAHLAVTVALQNLSVLINLLR